MNFYNFITDPTNNVKVNINSATAKKVIENYINYINTHSQQFGGSGDDNDDAPPSYASLFGPATASLTAQELRLVEEAEDAARVTQEEVKRAKEAVEVQRAAEEAVRLAKAGRLAKEAAETARAAEEAARAADEARQAAEEAERSSKVARAAAKETRRLEEVRIAQIKATELAKEEANRKEEERRDDEEIAQLRKELEQVESEITTVQAKKDKIELDIQTGAAIAKIKQDTKGINVAVLQLKDKLSADEAELKTALPAKEDEHECILCYNEECAPSKAFIIDDEECVCFECIVRNMFNDDPKGQYLSDGGYDHHPPLTRVSLRYILERKLPDNFADKRVWAKFRFDGDADNIDNVDNIDNPGHFSKMTTCLKRGVACRRKVNVADDEADGAATEEEVVDGGQTDFYIDATSFSFLQGLEGVMSESDGMPITNMITNYLTNKYKYDRDKLATLKTTKETKEVEEAKSADNLSKLGERKAELEVKLGVDTRWGQVKHFFGRG